MPEGDTIHRLAAQLGPRLVGKRIERLVVRGVERAAGTVAAVEALGKHLVIALDDGTEIRTHLGMNGRWHRHDRGSAVGGDRVTLIVETADDLFACRRAAAVEVTARRAPGRGMAVASLGPDLLDPATDLATVIDRVAAQPATRAIGEVVMDQRVAAGIGNIYRCEALFRLRLDPRTPIGDVDPDEVLDVYRTARDLLRESVDARTPERLVHGRGGAPCVVCGTPIRVFHLADRLAYACFTCQHSRKP